MIQVSMDSKDTDGFVGIFRTLTDDIRSMFVTSLRRNILLYEIDDAKSYILTIIFKQETQIHQERHSEYL